MADSPKEAGRKLGGDIRKLEQLIGRSVNVALSRHLARVRREMQTQKRVGRRSGNLARSWFVRQRRTNKLAQIQGEVGSRGQPSVYGRVQDRGATITPKRAKYLTIPLKAALTPAGVPRRPNARAWEDTFVLRRQRKLFIVQKRGDGNLTFLYVLKKRVRIPARLKFRESEVELRRRHLLPDIRTEVASRIRTLRPGAA